MCVSAVIKVVVVYLLSLSAFLLAIKTGSNILFVITLLEQGNYLFLMVKYKYDCFLVFFGHSSLLLQLAHLPLLCVGIVGPFFAVLLCVCSMCVFLVPYFW